MTNYKSLLIENRREKLQEAADKVAVKMSDAAFRSAGKKYHSDSRKCNKVAPEERKRCTVKAYRSFLKNAMSHLKNDYVQRCSKSENPAVCQSGIRRVVNHYEREIENITIALNTT